MGRPWGGGKPTPASFFSLDVRWLKREGLLRPGSVARVSETLNGKHRGAMTLTAAADCIVLDIEGRRQTIDLTETSVFLGGSRPWFVCSCGRRCAKVYGSNRAGGSRFACRTCKRIAYPSQSEDPRFRPTRRLQAIRESLGGSANLTLPFPPKPKGMHWRTYDQAHAKAQRFEQRTLAGMMATLERMRARMAASA